MIAVINSVLIGSFVGLLLAAFTFPLWVGTSAGVVDLLGECWSPSALSIGAMDASGTHSARPLSKSTKK